MDVSKEFYFQTLIFTCGVFWVSSILFIFLLYFLKYDQYLNFNHDCTYFIFQQIGPARFRAPEVLFRPDLIGEEYEGLHEVLLFSIQKSDLDLRRVLFQNIVLSGGSTLFKVLITCSQYFFCANFFLKSYFFHSGIWRSSSIGN